MWYLLSFLILLLLLAGYVIYNLLKKVEQYEEDIQNKDEFLKSVKNLSDQSYKKLKELDSLEAFESDDETGHFFSNLKNIILTLDAYFKNYTK
jgi:CHASE3 domain sensor protein